MLVHRTWNIIRNMRKAIMITALLAASLSCFAAGTITVSGSAEVSAVPDMASFTLTASFTEQTTKEAMDRTSAMINEAIAILESEYGLADDDITTSYIGVSPEYTYKDGERVHTGQSASQSLEITIRNMDSIGPIYGRLSELDGITLSSISLSSTKMAEALKAARIGAVNDARDKAETYAEAAGGVRDLYLEAFTEQAADSLNALMTDLRATLQEEIDRWYVYADANNEAVDETGQGTYINREQVPMPVGGDPSIAVGLDYLNDSTPNRWWIPEPLRLSTIVGAIDETLAAASTTSARQGSTDR